MNQLNKNELKEITRIALKNQELFQELNSRPASQAEIRQVISNITGHQLDSSVEIRLPIRSDYGANLKIGKEVFINSGAMFTDLGGIVIEDKVLIAPNVTIISVNHPLNPAKRRGLELKPVRIKENAWIGANATILPGVTVGKNAVVAAGAVVTKNVPDNMVVAGVPAKGIKKIGED
ncbi:DapH/DapD/GlmU-related protein [Limosilactobacillus fastidiosus]|uniref:Sugar O-acetyltransferase n=1 Tax=Limosilactobacillus fastidiosus TaxID=2759855 RepID=A0A7W3YC34_9LACO|nr:DapH/DapD/GlmU-related protein [Limosilactobacillus fastidiosus]MBB1063562.1 sugar O-acetyltransferase [Limosilactobacillus fastidiosus]MBB1086339.1 sugar O-acetyltransferase [Limosilactobacillus fastidiosus]MCD7084006.1 sugar O-acetyltransferase [Limosilactobacillus fastidiosus]MCD7086444.1 sugar O-acetyltransferase [Limosilactobacillus fastidiosus]MCD7114200.1 sugar O-acetyltransferase [Limosilactobacillus fastidiosus]